MEPVLTKFVVGETSFYSRGVSKIKMTVDGIEQIIRVPIKSIGIIEMQQRVTSIAPKPKEKMVIVKKDTSQGRQMKLEEDTPMLVLDYADEEYLRQVQEHSRNFVWRMLATGIDAEFTDKAGNRITDQEQIIEALKHSGLTDNQCNQLLTDIQELTSRREARADFLSGNASA